MYEGLLMRASPTKPHVGGNIAGGDPLTYAPSVWDYLINRFCINSVLDLGAGEAHAANYFHNKGLKVLAVDGMEGNCANKNYPTVHIDLTKGYVTAEVDLVHCQEVVEHIEEKYIDNLLISISCGNYFVMTHALPGQGGYHHVNEQPSEYWVQQLDRYGFVLLAEDSKRVRQLAVRDGAVYLARTGLVFANTNGL